MAKIVCNNVELEIIPIGHYYRSDGSDTNEFYYAISLYEDKKRQSYPLGINNGLIDVFEIGFFKFGENFFIRLEGLRAAREGRRNRDNGDIDLHRDRPQFADQTGFVVHPRR